MPGIERVMRRLDLRKEGDGKFAKITVIMKNGRGSGDIARGEPVILDKDDSTGNAVDLTSSGADALIFGMADELIANGSSGRILVYGWTDALKVNGTDPIVTGDEIVTYAAVGIGKKASADEVSFAVAMEGYSGANSDGVIDAIVHSPAIISVSAASISYGSTGEMVGDGVASANDAGSTGKTARIDHAHANAVDTPALTLSSSNSAGTAGSILAADATIALFDSTAPGNVLADANAASGSAAVAAR